MSCVDRLPERCVRPESSQIAHVIERNETEAIAFLLERLQKTERATRNHFNLIADIKDIRLLVRLSEAGGNILSPSAPCLYSPGRVTASRIRQRRNAYI
ncbi:hypothetical protein [Caballeronia sp. INML2]|jgi:hypothetical protein|uniref:hypothetical protein n=1 Tax=Caballeronia sp. INML2 TaxID=2921748 RepID=UPI0020284E96|nr:hypothetical protein [Caballeronia sp. INML2]